MCITLWRNKYYHLISGTPDSKTMDKGMGNNQIVSSESNNEDQKDSNMYIYTESKLLIVLIFYIYYKVCKQVFRNRGIRNALSILSLLKSSAYLIKLPYLYIL